MTAAAPLWNQPHADVYHISPTLTAAVSRYMKQLWAANLNYPAPSSLVFMPIHISCSSAQNNVKLRYADVGNWWPRQQTQPQTAFYKLIGLISAGGGEYTVHWLSLSSIWCVDISCVQLKNNNKLPHTEERSWQVLSAPQRNKQHISAI